MLLALIGVAIGVAASFGLARFLETLLYQIKPTDPLAFTVAPALLLGVALLACYAPARRQGAPRSHRRLSESSLNYLPM